MRIKDPHKWQNQGKIIRVELKTILERGPRLVAVIKDITKSNLNDIPEICSHCIYWSFPEDFERIKSELSKRKQELTAKKRLWIRKTLEEFGSCGKIVYHNNVPVGYAEYGPPSRFPQIKEYKSQPVGKTEDGVVFLSCLYIADENLRGKGLGEKLLCNILADLKERGFKAVETYARKGSQENPSGPVELYLKKGFHIKDETNPEFPLVRLNLLHDLHESLKERRKNMHVSNV